jgi:hypothetical protein
MISKLLVASASFAALTAAAVGLLVYTSIPTQLGFWRLVASHVKYPGLIGFTPAFHSLYGIPCKYTWEEFYQQDLTAKTAIVTGGKFGHRI